MKKATVTFRSQAPYSQSRYHDTPKLSDKESSSDYENRVWRERLHYDANGFVVIPGMSFKKSVERAASFLSMKVPGKGNGKATYAKHFKAGVLVQDNITLSVKKDDVPGETYFVPSDGRSGGGTRVKKTFPVIQKWEGELDFYILDETINEEVFERHVREAGSFIGVGRFRPENGGLYGRYEVVNVKWSEV